ncbi:MAG: single-stranded DNA-binding protein [Thermodesulfovibrionales bacterium]
MYNKVILIGNLTKDPEMRYLPQGTPVCSFRLACTTKYKSKDAMKDETLFIDVVVFGKQAETTSQYLNKGSRALVEGRLQERRWESDGQQRSKFEIVADSVRFLSTKRDASSSDSSTGAGDFPAPEETTDIEPF